MTTSTALRALSLTGPARITLLFALALAALTASAPASAQTVATDYPDYSPGDTVVVTGTGWLPGERVSLFFNETPYQFIPLTLYTDADSTGAIWSNEYIIQPYHLGTSFVLTAYGLTSGLLASTTFTDSPKVGSVAVGSQSGIPCAGTSGTGVFTVTVNRGNVNGSSGAFTANLSVTSGLPSGVSASFSPNPVSFTPGSSSQSATLTLTTSAGTPSGGSTFSVKAATSATDTAATIASFTVNQPLSITSPGNLTANNTVGQCGATVPFVATATGSPTPTITYSQNPGTLFPIGVTTVTATATNTCGSSSTTFTVTVTDTEKPALTAPADLTVTAGGTACGATVGDGTLGTASATDNCSATVLRFGVPAGNFFPTGTTTLTYTATDPSGNSVSATQRVTVVDDTPPAIATAPITVSTAGSCTATVPDLGTTASDNCGSASLAGVRSDGAPLASPFPTGPTTITWTATDASGNTASATQIITVEDHENPVLSAPANLTVTTGADATACGVELLEAALGTATATDNCSATVTRGGVPSNGFFPVGTTTLTYTATDPSGNSVSATQLVTVVDTTPPAISTGTLDVSTGEGTCTATIESLGTTAADNCGGTTLTGTRSDGAPLADPFPIGSTTIAWTATDAAGNTANATQTVTVSDHEAPSIAHPTTLATATPVGAAQCGVMIPDEALVPPIATDNCSATVTRSGVPDGNLFPVGTTTITWTATDPSGNSASTTQLVVVADTTPPAVTAPPAITLFTGPAGTQCGLVVASAALGAATATDNCSATVARTGVPSGNLFPVGTTTLTYTATDAAGNSASATQTITIVDNTLPKITTADLNATTGAGVCGATIADLGTTATDNCSVASLIGTRSDGAPIGDAFPLGTTTITWVATDASGNTATATQTVTVANPTPTVTIVSPASGAIYPAGASVTMTGSFTDNAGDLHTARWVCDALSFPATVDETAQMVSGAFNFPSAGVYCVQLQVTDQCGNTASATTVAGLQAMVVVYDPGAGFVTGGGWIDSPTGAYATVPALTGKANFGFVSKYKKGQSTPTGETEFQFKAGDLNFHSTSYDWLVVSGPKAQFKGSGMINGAGSFGFLLTSTDGQAPGGGGKDKFRIKITDKASGVVVYDNQMGAADTASATCVLGGGSIVIQSQGGVLSAAALAGSEAVEGASTAGASSGADPAADAIFQNAPNPFNPETLVRFALAQPGRATVRVFNARGQLVHTVADGWFTAGSHTATWNGATASGGRAASGVYYAVLETAAFRGQVRMILIK